MAENIDILDMIENELANSGLTMKEIEQEIPLVYSLMTSVKDKSMRENTLLAMLANKEFQKQLRTFDNFKKFDFNKYDENADKINQLPKNLEEADIKDVENFYTKAKQIIDPNGRLGNTELYDTAGPKTFEQLEGDGDWFMNLLNGLGYPTDTPDNEYKSIDQFAKDFQTVLTRMKNHNFADKYGKAKTPLKFMFGRSFDVLEDGKKPTEIDFGIDAGTNILWSLPIANWLRPVAGVAKPVVSNVAKNVGIASLVPFTSELADSVIGTDTEREKRRGLQGRVNDAVMNTAINLVTPGLAKRAPSTVLGITNFLGMTPKENSRVTKWISDHVDYGSTKEAAKAALSGISEAKDEASQVVSRFAQRLNKKRGAVGDWTLDNIRTTLPGYLQEGGATLAKMIKDNGRSFKKGRDAFLKSVENTDEGFYKQLAEAPSTLWDELKPFLTTYGINRLGTNGVAGWIRRRFGDATRPWENKSDDE